MLYSETACEAFIPQLRKALDSSKRKAVGVRMGNDSYALETTPGSLSFLRHVTDKPFFLCEEEAVAVPNGEKRPERAAPSRFLRYNLPLWSSKYGGFGFLPKSVEYPRNRNTNNPLALMVQLNLDELPHYGVDAAEALPPHFPTQGILAFYTDPFDDLYGCDMENMGQDNGQVGYRVLYFPPSQVEEELYKHIRPLVEADDADMMEKIEKVVETQLWSREEQYNVFATCGAESPYNFHLPEGLSDAEKNEYEELRKRELWKTFGGSENKLFSSFKGKKTNRTITRPTLWYGNPIECECAARLGPVMDMLPHDSVEFYQLIRTARLEHPELADPNFFKPPLSDDYEFTSTVSYMAKRPSDDGDDYPDDLFSERPATSHLGGYPRFTQNDPRNTEDPDLSPDATDTNPQVLLLQLSDCNEMLMFGDAGECSLFISPEDLEQGRFERAWFSWDCC